MLGNEKENKEVDIKSVSEDQEAEMMRELIVLKTQIDELIILIEDDIKERKNAEVNKCQMK